jgi:cytochrome oxidase Cu insertion factor (SCO1/SenC/PrrC family)
MSKFDRSIAPKGRRWLLACLLGMVLLAGGGLIALGWMPELRNEASSDAIGGPFTLTVSNGQKVSDRDFRGKWLLVYFGYTHCPDICPTTLAEISETLTSLGQLAAEVQPLFVSIDPERDTPGMVGDFINRIDDRIIGLTGTPAQIAVVAKEYHVYYAKDPPSPAPGEDYAMDHTAFVYVMGSDGKYLTLFSPLQGQTPDDMAAKLRALIGVAQAEPK